jgi:hypothetical protein
MRLGLLKILWSDPYGGAGRAIPHAGGATGDACAQVAFDGHCSMAAAGGGWRFSAGQENQGVEVLPKRFFRGCFHHEDHAIGAKFGAVAAADAFVLVNAHNALRVTHSGVARGAVLEAGGTFAMTAGNGHMDMGKARAVFAVETSVAAVGGGTGGDAVITPDAFGLIDEQDIGAFYQAMFDGPGQRRGLAGRFEDNRGFSLSFLNLLFYLLRQIWMCG